MKLVVILLAWLAFFIAHSALASFRFQTWACRHWAWLKRGYRLIYNLFAVLTLLPVLWLVYTVPGEWLWQWTGGFAWIARLLTLLALLGFVVSTRAYDMGEFLGVRQIGKHNDGHPSAFSVSFFHRYVRHPWYSLGLILIWTRDMNPPLLVSALVMTIYLMLGSKLEERKLIAIHGEKYRRYMDKVPGLFPNPWRYLKENETELL